MIRNITLLTGLLFILLASVLTAQEAGTGEAPFFESVDVEIVNVEVFVTDRKGNPVTGLSREDFRLLVDGAEVPVSNFYAQADGRPTDRVSPGDAVPPPEDIDPVAIPVEQRLHLVVFVDNLHLRAANRKRTFQHLRAFLDQHLRPGDLVTVVSQNRTLFIHNDFLGDRAVLDDILDEVQRMATQSFAGEGTKRNIFQQLGAIRSSNFRNDRDTYEDSLLAEIRAYAQSEFSLAEASLGSLERLVRSLGGIKGRKALIHVSDGIATKPGEGMYESWFELFSDQTSSYERNVGSFDLLPQFRRLGRVANASGVTFYAIDAETDHKSVARSSAISGGEGGIVPIQVLEKLENNPRETLELTAQTTGGRRLQRTPKLTENLGRIANDFASFYSLGFAAQDMAPGADHQIEVEVLRKGLRVRHRETFQSRQRDVKSSDFAMAALLYNAVDNPLGIRLEPGDLKQRDDGTSFLTVMVKIPVDQLVLLPRGSTHAAQLSFFVSVKGAGGDPRPVQKIPFHLPIPADKVEEARGQDASYPLELVIRPGDLQAVVGVRDDFASQESAVRLDLDRVSGAATGKKRRGK